MWRGACPPAPPQAAMSYAAEALVGLVVGFLIGYCLLGPR